MRLRASWVALAAMTLACAALPAAADAIQQIIDQVTVAEYQSYIRVLSGVDPVYENPHYYIQSRHAFSGGAHIAAEWIQGRFESWGLSTYTHIFNWTYPPNVVAELPGTTRPQDIYLITGHYDTVPNTPGADDNASGTSAVMTAARILSQYQFEGTLRFIAFSGEEEGLVGSEAYAAGVAGAGENIAGVINLDMILHPAWDNTEPDPDYDLDIGTNAASDWLAQDLAAKFAQYTPIDVEVWLDTFGNSDHSPFWQYGYSAIRLSEHTTPENWYEGANDAYHQPTDTFDNPDYDYEFAHHAVRGSMAELISLAGLVPEPHAFAALALAAAVARCRAK